VGQASQEMAHNQLRVEEAQQAQVVTVVEPPPPRLHPYEHAQMMGLAPPGPGFAPPGPGFATPGPGFATPGPGFAPPMQPRPVAFLPGTFEEMDSLRQEWLL
jgi:hypothetical protein